MPKLDLMLLQDMPHPDFIEIAQLVETHGFENLWLVDSQDVYPDVWTTAALCAVNTSQMRIGPGVTNPFTRHPRVTANAALTVHELSGGRSILGIGAGDSAIRTMKWQPAGVRAIRDAVKICRDKFKEKGADIPIYVAANGPKPTAYACKEADGIITSGEGCRIDDLRRVLGRVETAVKEAGRDFTKFPLLPMYGFAISHDRQEAYDEARGPVAKLMMIRLLNRIPWPTELDHLLPEAQRMNEEYDYMDHMKSYVPHAQLVSDEFVEAFGLAGTPEDVIPKFKAMWREVEGLNFTFYLRPDGKAKKRSLELFVKEVLPELV